jgi:hypothetical protein
MTTRKAVPLLVLLVAVLGGCAWISRPPALAIDATPVTAATLRFAAPFGWVTYEWHFGDGEIAVGRTAEHQYSEAGEYSVSLKAIDLEGLASFAHRTVTACRDIQVDDYGTLQLAVTAAAPGDWLFLDGEFAENVIVDKAVTLLGPCTLRPGPKEQAGSEGQGSGEDPALLVTAGGVVLKDIAFRAEPADQPDRGVLRIVSADVYVSRCTFEGISGTVGSAVHLTNSGGRFEDCSFSDNEASIDGGAVYCIESDPRFVGCTFSGNDADGDGGAAYCEGDAAFPAFDRCTFTENHADAGGAIIARATTAVQLNAAPLHVKDCTFVGNVADGAFAGGAIHVGNTVPALLVDNTFSANGPQDVVIE